MGLTSRRKRPLDRTIKHYRDTRLIIIAAEGEKTEKQYFESKLFGSQRVQVKVLETHDGLSAPQHVLDRLKTFAEDVDLQEDDQLWLVVDRDRTSEKVLSHVSSHAVRGRKNKAKLAVSNPCIELWFYLHYEDWSEGNKPTSGEMEGLLRELLKSYNKSKLDIEAFAGRVDQAVGRAEKMDKQPSARWPNATGTHVYKLVKAIRKLERS